MPQTSSTIEPEFVVTREKSERWAWWICWLMFASTVLCYMDRQTIALVKEPLTAEFAITDNETFGWLLASFGMTYALFQVPAGFLADMGDVRIIYAMAVAGWSLAGIAASFSPTLGVLIGCRVMLGVGESFNWPCGLRITSRILAPADRSLGNGIFNSGAAVGAVVAPLTIPALEHWYGWRSAFAVVGGLGFVWVALWLGSRAGRVGRITTASAEVARTGRLSNQARLAFAAIGLISVLTALSAFRFGPAAIWWGMALLMIGVLVVAAVLPESHLAARHVTASLGVIVRLRRFWVMTIVAVTINICWHFLASWIAIFFQEQRSLGMLAGGMVSVVPFVAADAGNLIGGSLSRRFNRRGMSLIGSRRSVMLLGAGMVACGTTVGAIENTALVIVVVSAMALGVAAFMANYFALCQDVSPRHTGLVVGVLGGLGNLFAAGFMPIAGRLRDVTGGFGTSFAIVGLLPIVGVLALALGWGRDSRAGGAI